MRKILVANWKQNKNLAEVEGWLSEFGSLIEGKSYDIDVVIAPSHPYLAQISEFAKNYDWVYVGAQDISAYENGTHTGEVGGEQLKDFVKYCIVGHSERGEDTSAVLEKIKRTEANGITPIICFVEPEKLNDINKNNSILLWEDPGNISQGGIYIPKPSEEIESGVKEIKSSYSISSSLIYGGSINRQNASDLGKIAELDGGIVGGASLDAKHFFDILTAFTQ